jgi:hypothetical protein
MKKIILFSFLLLQIKSFAQNEIGLNFSKTLWQANAVNPAFVPQSRVVIASPSISVGYYNTFGGLRVTNGVLQLKKSNSTDYIAGNSDISFGGLGFAIKQNGYLSFSQTLRTEGSLTGSGNLFQLVVGGNAQFIGKKLEFSPKFNYNQYNEFGVTYAHHLEKLTVGAKVKLFTGVASIQTGANTSASLTTDSEAYQLQFDLDYKLQASKNVATILGGLNNTPNFENSKFSTVDGIGMGLDLGATYNLNDKISLGLSANNLLASIKWNGGKEYATKAKFNIDGIDIIKLVKDSTFSLQAPNLDTVVKNMKFTSIASDFRTRPAKSFILTGSYKANKFLTANALLAYSAGRSYAALNTTVSLKKWLEAGLTYSIRNNSFSDLGTNIALKVGPIQAYCIADNFLAAFKPLQVHNFNVRVGANIVIGTIKKQIVE